MKHNSRNFEKYVIGKKCPGIHPRKIKNSQKSNSDHKITPNVTIQDYIFHSLQSSDMPTTIRFN
jgi:hypothetical protein